MKPKRITHLEHSAKILVGSLATLLVSHSAQAVNVAWSTAPADANFTGINWTAGTVPGAAGTTLATGDALFFGASTVTTLTDDEAAGWNLAGLTFNSGAAAFTINGTNSNNLTGNITNSSTNLQVINVPLALTATRTVTMTTGGGDVTLGGAISGATFGLTTAGAGTLALSGANTYSGTTTIAAGTTLKLSNQLAVQNSTLALSGAVVLDSSVGANAFTLGGLSGAGNLALLNSASTAIALTVGGNNASTTYSGVLSGAGSLTKTGTGTLTLSSANTYTGITTVSGGGSIQITSDANLGTAPASAVGNQLTLDNGTLLITNNFNLATNRGVTLGAGGGTINLNGTNNAGIPGVITGPGALTVITSNANGRVLLLSNNNNTFAGGVVLSGTAQVTASVSNALGTGTLTLGTTNSGNNPVFRLQNTITVGNAITVTAGGTRTIQNDSGNTGTLSGPITLTGGATNPTLNFSSSQNGSTLIISGGVTGTGNVAFAGDVNGRSNTNTTISGTSINNIGTISNLSANNTGTDTISAVIGTNVTGLIQNSTKQNLVLSGNNSGANFFGDTTLTAGTINLQNANALANSVVKTNGTAGALTFGAGGTNITAAQIGGLNGAGNATAGSFGNIVLVNSGSGAGALALSIGNSNVSNGLSIPNTLNPTYSGIISGAGSITKTGTNTQTFSGVSTYTGATTVSAGTLLVNGALGNTASTTVAAPAALGGTGQIANSVTAAGTITGATQGSIGTLTTGALNLQSGSTYAYDIATGLLGGDALLVNGGLTLDNNSMLQFTLANAGALSAGSKLTLIAYSGSWNNGTFNGYANNSSFNIAGDSNVWQINYADTAGGSNLNGVFGDSYTTITVVPETSAALLGALGGLVLLRRRRSA